MDHIGMDVGMLSSHICELTEAGEVVERQIRTERRRLREVFGSRPKARILIEASTESEWIACCLEDLGHEVIVADPNYAPMYAQRSRRIKTTVGTRTRWRTPVGSARIGRRTGRHRLNETCARSWVFASCWSARGLDGLSTAGPSCGGTDSASHPGTRSALWRA